VKIWNAPGDQGTHSDHGKPANRKVISNGALGADGGSFLYERGKSFFIGLGRTQALEIDRSSTRKSIVREDCASTDHDTILDSDSSANVDERVNLDPITDFHVVRDVRFFPDNALFAD
jgi:hypothetical protein